MPEVGERAPDFALPDQGGNQMSLGDLLGQKKVMLVFYVLSWTGI